MRISEIETFLVGNPWKNWLFVCVDTDEHVLHLFSAGWERRHETLPLTDG